ncbi:MAG: hypothetical protein RMK89_14115, partial [Armatimonadota bacterium]|nr:hypothetical protein [Armatimonadota bacterium]MDW8144579.1 hypothetical protein [Armatimonadota bacterium]
LIITQSKWTVKSELVIGCAFCKTKVGLSAGNLGKGLIAMLKVGRKLDRLTLRMTVALLKCAVNETDADAQTLCDVAHLVCRSLKDLRQTDRVNEALRWANKALAYDDDAVLARWCLIQTLKALKGATKDETAN